MLINFLVAIISLLAGMTSGLLGIGGGVILVPFFHYLLRMNMHLAIGTSLAIIVPTTFIAAFRHTSANYVDWRIVLFASIFSIVGGFLGASISMNLDIVLLRRIFALVLILIAIRMLFQ